MRRKVWGVFWCEQICTRRKQREPKELNKVKSAGPGENWKTKTILGPNMGGKFTLKRITTFLDEKWPN